MPGGEIIPSAQRGVIDCAEWVGGVEDLRLGFHNVWKYHYTPGMHENVTIGEVVFNVRRVEEPLAAAPGDDQVGARNETFLIWWAKWQKQNADALKELQEKHGVRILRTPPDILIAFLKTWDEHRGRGRREEPVLQEGARVAAPVRVDRRAGEALLLPAVLVRGQLLLAGEGGAKAAPRRPTQRRSSSAAHERGRGSAPVSF